MGAEAVQRHIGFESLDPFEALFHQHEQMVARTERITVPGFQQRVDLAVDGFIGRDGTKHIIDAAQ